MCNTTLVTSRRHLRSHPFPFFRTPRPLCSCPCHFILAFRLCHVLFVSVRGSWGISFTSSGNADFQIRLAHIHGVQLHSLPIKQNHFGSHLCKIKHLIRHTTWALVSNIIKHQIRLLSLASLRKWSEESLELPRSKLVNKGLRITDVFLPLPSLLTILLRYSLGLDWRLGFQDYNREIDIL